MDLPTGTITFLFTDIEGSTRLWEEHREPMRVALARHDALLQEAIQSNNGVVFKTMGDAFCAAFHTAPNALDAALQAQRLLQDEPWPDALRLKVRMALHTGAADMRDKDYFGPPLNRVERLRSAGHGGQVLLSFPTEELIRDDLPPAATLRNLGEHWLLNLNRPETVFQLLHPDLPSEFPPLRSLDNPALPNNLPRQLTSFIGRENEVEAITSLLNKASLLTLIGSGGGGKTRLALQVAAEVLEGYADGVWVVELAPLADLALVPQTIASALNVPEQAGKSYSQNLTDSLKSKHLLLVLDNCEHLLSACVQLCDELLRSCPNVRILATSREVMGISGEQTYRVPSLSHPDPKQTTSVESISQYEAVRLFIERALLVKPEFKVTNQNAPALASVCHRLDGIPLAIELAAARVRSLSVEEINDRLDNRFRLLTGGSKTALPRQQTLRATIDWSYNLLNTQEKTLLARLSVFAAGWTLHAAERVCAGEGASGTSIEEGEVLDLLTSLVDKSLVSVQGHGDASRYRMLETVREYAREYLVAVGEEGVSSRHLDFFLDLAEKQAPDLEGVRLDHGLEGLDREYDNLRTALEWCSDHTESAEIGLRVAVALSRFWYIRGMVSEGRKYLDGMLLLTRAQGDTLARAKALHGLGLLAWKQGRLEDAQSYLSKSVSIYEAIDQANRNDTYDRDYAYCWHSLGNTLRELERLSEAKVCYERSLNRFAVQHHQPGIAFVFKGLAELAYKEKADDVSRSFIEECLRIRRDLHDEMGIANTLQLSAALLCRDGCDESYTEARRLYREALPTFRKYQHIFALKLSFIRLGIIAEREGNPRKAAILFSAAHKVGGEINDAPLAFEKEDYESSMRTVKGTLGESFEHAWQEGQNMTLDQAIEYALQEA